MISLGLATDAQRRATTPSHSAWVEANAGTGKTKVLTDRVTRLLLDGVKPERILCLTFTKAAAAEMRNRLATQLGRWALAPQPKLDEEVEQLIDRTPDPAERVAARRLFARVLDAPGGINILTIHAFCQALLKRFPLEAGVAPGFEVLDEAEAQTLLRHAQDEQMEALARHDAPPALVDALASVAGKISIAEYADLMTRLLSERVWLLARIGDEAGLRRVRARLASEMGCAPDDTAGGLTSEACLEAAFDAVALHAAARALAKGSKTDVSRAKLIAEWLADAEGRPSLLPAYSRAFFTDKGSILKRLATKAAIEAMPEIEKVLQREAERLESLLDRINGAALVEHTLALLRLGLDIAGRYSRTKRRRAALDYDDLIVATRRLLESAASAAWVLYKLDGGIDHVLVDEAQDTNPDQWEVIRRLTEEFFVGQGAVERSRTVFAVGDTKQSIFGFQRADPRKLKEMREWFAEQSRIAEQRFVPVDLNVSFRSTPAVLDAVDWVFGEVDAARGVAEPGGVTHLPSRKDEPGRVELWPLVSAPAAEIDTTNLEGPRGALSLPHERLAHLIAVHAKSLIGREQRARKGELLHAGHFMVLVRRRNEFVNALVRALKREGIEVAGVDRLNLGEELAIQDLLAAARFVLLPQDDLNLACLLKSPLIGLSEEQLFTLAWQRTGHLWRALRARAGDASFTAAHARLSAWLKRADYITPFDFFAEALGPEGGRVALLERLGREAADPIDELLARALQYQRAEGSSLQGFLRWFEAGGGEIKRDLDQNRRREVRILTVHASKGLQAPIVYLPDTTRVPRDAERLLSGADGEARLWLPRADDANEAARTLACPGARARARGAEPPALCRHDPRRGPALCRRLGGREEAGSRLLVRAHRGGVQGKQRGRQRRAAPVRLHDAARPGRLGGRWLRTHQCRPDRAARAGRIASGSGGQTRTVGARARARRTRPTDAAGALATAAGRRSHKPAGFQPAGTRRFPALATRPAAARTAAPSARAAGSGARACGRALPRTPSAWIDRRGDRALDRGGARRHRSARACRLVRRRLARRGAADRHGEDAARHLHRQRPGRPAGRLAARSADRRLQDQPAAAAIGLGCGARLSPAARTLSRAARRHLSRPYGTGFPAVDSGAFIDGNRCGNA